MVRDFAPHVCFPFVGRALGGSHVSSLGLIKGLDARRYKSVVMLQHLDGPVYEYFRDNGVEAEAAPTTPALARGSPVGATRLAELIATAPRLARRLRQDAISIVHCNDGRTSATWALAGKLAGAKVLWHNRGNPNALGLRLAAPLLADAVVSVSAFASPKPGLFSAALKNTVIFSPFDIHVLEDRVKERQALVDELAVDARTTIIGYFGALVARKRPVLFVDTIAEMRARSPGSPILGLMFGEPRDGFDRLVKARAVERGVADAVRMMGFRAPGSRWIAACDLLLSPGVGEPLGRTLIEAMLVGTPVVATDSGGNPEAVRNRETGLLAPPENASALAEAALLLLNDRQLAADVARNAAADARVRFSVERHVEAIMRLYDELLSPMRSRRAAPPAMKEAGPTATAANRPRRATDREIGGAI
jgi:glycosyltransferase involved in cell wall biosynthesis